MYYKSWEIEVEKTVFFVPTNNHIFKEGSLTDTQHPNCFHLGICLLPRDLDSTKKAGIRWVGDVDYKAASAHASHITPVPGGVGPMTVAMLMQNTYLSAVRFLEEARHRSIVPLPLQLLEPVPSDIAIALAQKPKPIKFIADELGILPSEVKINFSPSARQ